MARIAGRFTRAEPRRRVRGFVAGLLSDLPRKNCWTLAEHAGDATPDGMQHLLGRAVWDAEAVRDDVRGYETSSPATHAAGVPASSARVIIACARAGLVANSRSTGAPAAAHRAGSAVHDRGRYSSRSIIACPAPVA